MRRREGDYEKQVTLQIDGQSITVPLAEPLKDANGNVVQDLDGRDDAALHHDLRRRDEALRRRSEDSDPDTLSLAAHETSRGLSFVCRPNLRTETRQACGRAKTSAGTVSIR